MEMAGRLVLIFVQLACLILSTSIEILTFSNPQQVEERLRSLAITEVEGAADVAWNKATDKLRQGGRA